MKKTAPYQMIQEKTGKVQFQAEFVKYYAGTPFCSVMAEYPAETTDIWVCRKVEPAEQEYGYRLLKLISHHQGQKNEIGFYVKVFQASSEKEAEDRFIANLIGTAAVKLQT